MHAQLACMGRGDIVNVGLGGADVLGVETGATCGGSGQNSELRKRLQRVQVFTEGDHTPSDGRLGPSEITHELLLVAQDIVSNGAPPVAGNSQLRLLAWLVANAMSADQPLDK